MKKRSLPEASLVTKAVILFGVAFYTIYDIVVYRMFGGRATESTVVGNWLVQYYAVLFLVMFLVGHLLASGPVGSFTWKHGLVAGFAMVLGFVITTKT